MRGRVQEVISPAACDARVCTRTEVLKKVSHVLARKIGGIKLKKDSDEVKIEYPIPEKITAEMGKVPAQTF